MTDEQTSIIVAAIEQLYKVAHGCEASADYQHYSDCATAGVGPYTGHGVEYEIVRSDILGMDGIDSALFDLLRELTQVLEEN
jgi:hypothetical protein